MPIRDTTLIISAKFVKNKESLERQGVSVVLFNIECIEPTLLTVSHFDVTKPTTFNVIGQSPIELQRTVAYRMYGLYSERP